MRAAHKSWARKKENPGFGPENKRYRKTKTGTYFTFSFLFWARNPKLRDFLEDSGPKRKKKGK
jgi:hypothetical protein